MCIPCVMCGSCINPQNAETLALGTCPECGLEVPDDAISCPNCYAFLYRPTASSSESSDESCAARMTS